MGRRKDTGPPHLGEALRLCDMGWSVVPLCHPQHLGSHPPLHPERCTRPGKQAVFKWKDRQAGPMTPAEIRAAWERNAGYNLGVVTGRVSGIVMVDLDTAEGEAEWSRITGPDEEPTWEFSAGKGGRHLVYAWPYSFAPDGNPFPGFKGHIDFLGEGHLSVMPPSMHRSGVRYAWTVGGPGSDVPLDCFPSHLAAAIAAGVGRASQTNTGGDSRRDDPPLTVDPSRLSLRSMAYTKAFRPSVEGAGGDANAYTLACALVHGFGLDDETAVWLMLNHWNARCEPPWPERAIRHKVEYARSHGHFDRIEERPMSKAARRPVMPIEVAIAAAAPPPPPAMTAPVPPSGPAANGGRKSPFVKASTLRQKEGRYFLPPFIPEGSLTLLAGRPGAGKSTFLAFLCSMARRSIYLVGEEDPEGPLVGRLDAHGVDRGSVDIATPSRDFRLPDALGSLEQHVRSENVNLVIADPLSAFFESGMNADSNADVERILYALADLAHRTNAAIVAIRHPGKQQANLLRGAQAWMDIPRTVVELVVDPGPPERRFIRHAKNNAVGGMAPPRYFDLARSADSAPVLTMGDLVKDSDADGIDETADRIERIKCEEAEHFLRGVLSNGPVESVAVYKQGEAERFSDRTLRRAALRIGVVMVREGRGKEHKCVWSLPDEIAPTEAATPPQEGACPE